MRRRTKYILGLSLLAAGMSAVVVALVLRSNPAGARTQPQVGEISLGEPIYGGTGCPLGTARAVLSPDARTLSILFDEFVAETRPGRAFARASCNLAVPVFVPPGLSVSLLQVDYRGFARIPRGGSGTFRADYFFVGGTGPTVQRRFGSGYQRDFLVTDRVGLPVWSRCGESVITRVNSSAIVQKGSPWATEEGMVVVDTADIQGGIVFHLDYRSC